MDHINIVFNYSNWP